jgi:uncharacterized protein YoxC
MKKIKIIGVLIFVLFIFLVVLSNSISNHNQASLDVLNTINKQKAFTQEVSKNIFYIYRNKNTSKISLDDSIEDFLQQTNKQEITFPKKITSLWNEFYLKVQKFRDISKVTTAYSNLILEKLVNDIYVTNLKLVVELDKLLKIEQEKYRQKHEQIKLLQYILFLLFLVLLIYLFTQLKSIIFFIQKFLKTSKDIMKNSTIKGLKPIEVDADTQDILQATNNFNFLVQKIDDSIDKSSNSIQHSCKSVEILEQHIEEFLELFYEMQNDKEFSKEMTKKEDVLIQTLEELTTSAKKLEELKSDLDNLLSTR